MYSHIYHDFNIVPQKTKAMKSKLILLFYLIPFFSSAQLIFEEINIPDEITNNGLTVTKIDEAYQGHQFIGTTSLFFTKNVTDLSWIKSDSSFNANKGEYTSNGNLYITKGDKVYYSENNAITFNPIDFNFINLNTRHLVGNNSYVARVSELSTPNYVTYYTTNNGQSWTNSNIPDVLGQFKIIRVGHKIILGEFDISNQVIEIDINTNQYTNTSVPSVNQGFYPSRTIALDDGTFYILVLNYPDNSLYRYKIGQTMETVVDVGIISSNILNTSGTDLIIFEQDNYLELVNDVMVPKSYSGLPSTGDRRFLISESDHVFAIVDENRVFKSTESLVTPNIIADSNCIQILPDQNNNTYTIKGDLWNYEICILDASGQIIQTYDKLNVTFQIDGSQFTPGIYYLHLKNIIDNSVSVQKIVMF